MAEKIKSRRVKIISDGFPENTKVIDVESGKEIHARSIRWDIDKDNIGMAYIEVVMPKIEIETDADVFGVCPYCGRMEDKDAASD